MGSEPPDTGTPSLENRGPPAIIANGQLIDTQKWTISVSFLQIWASEPLSVCVCVCACHFGKSWFSVSVHSRAQLDTKCALTLQHTSVFTTVFISFLETRDLHVTLYQYGRMPLLLYMRLIYRWCRQGWSFVMPSDVWRWPIKCNIMSQVVNYPQQGSKR